jgi:hypothetical protein
MSNNNRIKELKQKIKNNPLSRSVPVLHDFSDEDKRSGHNTPDALLESEEDLEERSLEDVSGSPANKFKYKKVRSASEILSMTEEVLSQKLETTESECVAWIDKVLEICAETSLKPLLQELRTRITSHQQCSELIQQLHLQQQALTQQNLKLMITRLLLILGQLTRTKELMVNIEILIYIGILEIILNKFRRAQARHGFRWNYCIYFCDRNCTQSIDA